MALRLRDAVKRLSLKNSVCAERGIPALGDSVLPNESTAFGEKCSQDIRNASLRVFGFFAKKVLTIGDSKLLTRNKLILGGVSARLDLRAA